MKRGAIGVLVVCLALLWLAGTTAGQPRQPVYVGARVCGSCHDGAGMGGQFSLWLESKHSRAYASLFTPDAWKMAELSGVPGEPHESSMCLGCHATASESEEWEKDETFHPEDGVQCERCHGPGSEYMEEAVMRDPEAARAAGLRMPTPRDCLVCHAVKGSHVAIHQKPPLDMDRAREIIAHPTPADPRLPETRVVASAVHGARPVPVHDGSATSAPRYKTPLNLALSPDGRSLLVACEGSDSVIVVDAAESRKVGEISIGGQPTDVTFSPDGKRAYVSNRLDDTVSVLEWPSAVLAHTIPVGDEPHGVVTDPTGRWLFVLNTSEDSISIIDTVTFEEVKRLAASRAPWSLAVSPDGRRAFVTNTLSRFVEFREPSVSEVTVLDLEAGVVADWFAVPGANLLQGIGWHPDGEFALFTLNRTKNLVPMTRLLQGWTITNGLGIAWRDGRVDQVLLDEHDVSFPDPADVAISPDGRHALVTSATSDRIAVVDVPALMSILDGATDEERASVLPNHLGKPTEFVVARIPTGKSPRGVLFAPDGGTAWVANALDDSITVIDMERLEAVGTIDLGGPEEISMARRGERLFHSADIAFRRQFSCHTCHPDGHVDGITYDIEPDGIGLSPVDNRSLRGVLDTAPFKWEGTNPSLRRQCGPRLAVFFTRVEPFTPEELDALEYDIATIERPPNRYRGLGERLTPAQRRGKALYERTTTNDGRPIPMEDRCITCHPPPLLTDHSRRDVGTTMWLDREVEFDVPHLNNIYDSAPYLHNGISATLEEIWTRYNPDDRHGVTNDMTKDQLNDLIEYIKTF